ncbi:MAG: hypothetical protein MHM6MM_000650 [Cercozoa sp. M6MM]
MPEQQLPPLKQFVAGAGATCCATVFSNPFEVVKSRMQLQGELGAGSKVFRNPLQAMASIIKREGFRSVQQGIGPAMMYQIAMNGTRLSVYPALIGDNQNLPHRLFAGAVSGGIGALFGSPFFLLKVRLQVASHSNLQVGDQHNYKGLSDAVRRIYTKEGILGFFRGASAGIVRVMVGSATQLASYDTAKRDLLHHSLGWCLQDSRTHLAASLISGFAVAIAMNPPDVVATRLYNQSSSSNRYNSVLDCMTKVYRAEGVRGFYKGFWGHYMRVCPHTVGTFVFLEQFQSMLRKQ